MTAARADLSTCVVRPLVCGGRVWCWYVVSAPFHATGSNHTDNGASRHRIDADLTRLDVDGVLR